MKTANVQLQIPVAALWKWGNEKDIVIKDIYNARERSGLMP